MLTFFIKRPRFAMVIALVITLLGAIALKLIPVEQYPQITPPVVNVSASWPGASAADVAEAIATPLGWELPYAEGTAVKTKKRKKSLRSGIVFLQLEQAYPDCYTGAVDSGKPITSHGT